MKNHFGSTFYGTKSAEQVENGIQTAINGLEGLFGIFTGDNLFTYHRNLSFLDDEAFMASQNRHVLTQADESTIWRRAVVLWGFRHGLKLKGDFVECACYRGLTARIICDTVVFNNFKDRQYYLYDLFEHDATLDHHALPAHSKKLFGEVCNRLAAYKNVVVTQGAVPEVLEKVSPKEIAFMHLDLNNAAAEIGALEVLFDRMVPGAVLILDDYGWLYYRQQRLEEEKWFARRGYSVLELPTGQGLVIKA